MTMRRLAIASALATLTTACGSTATPTSASTANAQVAGNYTVTVRNAPTCPTVTRSWSVTVTQSGGTLAVNMTPPSGSTFGGSAFAGGTVSGNTVSFVAVAVIEQSVTSGNVLFSMNGQMTGTASGTTISGTLNGQLGTGIAGCTAVNHSVTFTHQ